MFRYIQTFYLDSASVKNSVEAGISKIDLYFRGKPKRTGNKSGIDDPGVEISIVPVINEIPIISELGTIRPTEPTEHGARFTPRFEISRREWPEIFASSDASLATSFYFDNPVFVKTKAEYGILIKYDGNEDFVLWNSKINDILLDTSKPATAPADRNVGKLFHYIGPPENQLNNITGQSNTGMLLTQNNAKVPELTPSQNYIQNNWKALSDTDLKFKLYVARYFHDGAPVASNNTIKALPEYSSLFPQDNLPTEPTPNVVRVTAPCIPDEYIEYVSKDSILNSVESGDLVYQVAPYWPGGKAQPLTISVTQGYANAIANGNFIQNGGNTFAASNGFYQIYNKAPLEYMIVDNGDQVNIRRVMSITNSTCVFFDKPLTFTNTAAKFMLAPVAEIVGVLDTFNNGRQTDLLVLGKSNANGTVRFVNNSITSLSKNVGGTGYANSDYIEISGFEAVTNKVLGGYKATANLVTNSTGGVTNVYISNLGCGFVNTSFIAGANIVVKNANGATSSGSSLTLAFTTGSDIKTEINTTTRFSNCIVTNLEASRIKPEITVNNPLGTTFTVNHKSLFYATVDAATFAGKAFYIYANSDITKIPVKIFKSHDAGKEELYQSVMPSRSNQFIIPYANGYYGNTDIIGRFFSNASVYQFEMSSNNDYIAPFFEPDIINTHYSKYIINNDYTNEHTNYGNAHAKHVGKKVNFNVFRSSEDVLIYLTAYRPAGTDFKVYARIHNNKDPEAFDDKDWSLLEQIDGINVFSSQTDSSDYKELTYNFVNSPNTDLTMNGTVTVANATTTEIVGVGTAFSTDLVANDLVKISQPLFTSNSFAICVVNSVTNSSHITLQQPIANSNGLLGSGLYIERIRTYKHQAFNNRLNSNVVMYFNTEMVPFDNYDNLQLKVVMVSNNDSIVCKIDDVRGMGVTA